MNYTRVKAYYNGVLVCEEVYSKSKNDAIDAFLRLYPEHKKSIVIAEDYDPVANFSHYKKVVL